MNENSSGAASIETNPLPTPYQDRSVGLVIFGVLTVLLGCLAILAVFLMLLGQAMSARTTNVPTNFATILPVIAMYGSLAVALVWLGVGSMMARRWARALLLIFSWSWLVMGVFVLTFMGFFIPKTLADLPPGRTGGNAAMGVVMVFMFLIFGVLFLAFPAVWAFFYGSRHVKDTCERRDPVRRWTDACPLPVLALCVWLMLSVLMFLLMPFMNKGVMPFFGMFLTGLPGTALWVVAAGVWSLAAWWLYKLDQRGWWLILIALCAFMVSGLLTYGRHDVVEMYRLMNYPEAQIDQIQKMGLFAGNRMMWMTSVCMLPWLGYLLYVKRYLRRPSLNHQLPNMKSA